MSKSKVRKSVRGRVRVAGMGLGRKFVVRSVRGVEQSADGFIGTVRLNGIDIPVARRKYAKAWVLAD